MTQKRKARSPRYNFVQRAEENSNVDGASAAQRFGVKHDNRFKDTGDNNGKFKDEDRLRSPQQETGIEVRQSEVEPEIYEELQKVALRDLIIDRFKYHPIKPAISYGRGTQTYYFIQPTNPWIYQSLNLLQDQRNSKEGPKIKRDLDSLDKYENDLRYMAEGDYYQTYKDRLYNGGFDRMGYSQEDANEIRHYLDSGKIFDSDELAEKFDLIGGSSCYMFGGDVPYPGRIYLAKGSGDDPRNPSIWGVDQRRHNKDYYQEANPSTIAHEVGHYVDNYKYYKPVTKEKADITKHKDFKPSFVVDYFSGGPSRFTGANDVISDYFKDMRGHEILRRVEQIRNMFNIKDPNQPLTREQFDFAKRYYTTLQMDNNMAEFFSSIKDPDKFLEMVNNNRRVI